MKQVLQHLRNGQIELADVPCPQVAAGHLLIQTTRSLISPGTERMLVEFGQAGLIGKARAQPDKVKQVLAKIRTDGLLPTLETVFARLDEPLPLGYCNVGRVVEVGRGVRDFSVGDRVASNGPHAEMVHVPVTLAARIPEEVSDAAASFTVLGAISLQGVRLLQPAFGEQFVVIGLGLLGLVAAQLLRAHGANVLGVDVNSARCEMARAFGCQAICVGEGGDSVRAANAFSGGHGVDGVLITASAKTDEIMHDAATMCRKRGRIVLVGAVGLNLRRADFYEKELSFQVSCSYGPGRYDASYEGLARDYPRAFVRWTVARNFEAVLDALAQKRLDIQPLITKRIRHHDAAQAYEAVVNDPSVLGVVMEYPEQPAPLARITPLRSPRGVSSAASPLVVGVIGAGNFTKLVLLPAIKAAGGTLKTVASARGVTSFHAARKFEGEEASSDYRAMLADPQIRVVFITTRHASHPTMAAEALRAGKHVFVEKPLAIDEEGLELVKAAHLERPELQLMVGFNRRFAPHTLAARKLLQARSEPIAVDMLINAGEIPPDFWMQDEEVGGGRMIGEGCHFIDLAMCLVNAPITTLHATMFGVQGGRTRDDKMSVSMTFADGSIATVHYWSNGPKSYPKERVEIFSEGRVLTIDNWRRLVPYQWPAAKQLKTRMDKGHRHEIALFLERVTSGGPPLIPFEELELVTRASFAAVRSAREQIVIHIAEQTGDPAPGAIPLNSAV